MKQEIQVSYDNSIIAKLRNAFTDFECIYKEAMQNARRAGAKSVWFNAKPGKLSIRDDGYGFGDLQDFLTLAGSGWDQETIDQEGAFGMGSFSMLYGCNYIKVSSNGHCFKGHTQAILEGETLNLTKSTVTSGAIIEMKLDKDGFEKTMSESIRRLALGFPIDVYVNGLKCEHYHRLDDSYIETDIGSFSLRGINYFDPDYNETQRHLNKGTKLTLLYFQGLPVGLESSRGTYGYNIVHLNEQMFDVRMPDRDVLINQEKQDQKIVTKVEAIWKKHLATLKADLSAHDFANDCYSRIVKWNCQHLLNDVPVLPDDVAYTVTEQPFLHRIYHDDDFTTGVSVHRNDVGKVFLLDDDVEEGNIGEWLYAFHSKHLCCRADALHEDHWVHAHVVDINVSAKLVEKTAQKQFSGEWVYAICHFGKTVVLDGAAGEVELTNSSAFIDGEFYIPAQSDEGDDIFQVSDFTDNDDYAQLAAERDSELFEAFLISMNKSKIEAVTKAFNGSYIKALGITDGSFTVTFTAEGIEVEQLAA